MSKKLAEGIEGLVLDVKYGNGAFMKSIGDAEELAKALKQIGEDAGKKVIALITNMNQPLGSYIGNSLEIHECIEILQNKKNLNTDGLDLYSDCRELSLELAAYMVWIANPLKNLEQCRTDVNESLTSGKAYKKFLSVCSNQGGEIEKLPKSLFNITICSQRDGYIKSFNTEKIGISAIKIGAGRLKVTDKLDPSAGIQIHKKIGSKVANGDLLFTVYGNSLNILRAQESSLYECIEWSNIMVDKQILISNVLI
jgi:pyrimidine-nucleoside phosphorylase